MTSHFNFKITQEEVDKLSELLKWYEIVKGEMIDTLAVCGNVYTKIGDGGLEITGIWVDDAPSTEERLLSKLRETLDKSKKQHKQKHKVPFWANDYRRKK